MATNWKTYWVAAVSASTLDMKTNWVVVIWNTNGRAVTAMDSARWLPPHQTTEGADTYHDAPNVTVNMGEYTAGDKPVVMITVNP